MRNIKSLKRIISERKLSLNKLGQFGLILGILFLGEFLSKWFSLPIPPSILGMIILFALLALKIVKLKWVESVGNSLLDNLSVMFIPAGVAIVRELELFRGVIIPLAIIIFVSTTIVIVVTGYTVQALEDKKRVKSYD